MRTWRYSSSLVFIEDHVDGPGAGCGGACTRASTRAIKSSFQCSRLTCQVPSPIKTAVNSSRQITHITKANLDRWDVEGGAETGVMARGSIGGAKPASRCSSRRGRAILDRPAVLYGMLRIMSGDIGIMLTLRLCMTQSEPLSAITTITTVKVSASAFQPPSDLVFMCRK